MTPAEHPMNDHAAKLLRCIPQKILAKSLDPAHRCLEKQERPVAVVFVDVEGCTRLCEDLSPNQMNQVIEAYFSRFFDAVQSAGGTVNEIMGDGFMAIFDEGEIQNNTHAAVSAALAIQRQTRELNAQRLPELDPLLVNIGIHTGIGFVGFTKFRTSSGERWTYTASGPVTNIASRLCALATGGSILVSADIAGHIDDARYALEPLGPRKLKNVSRPVLTYRLSDASTGV